MSASGGELRVLMANAFYHGATGEALAHGLRALGADVQNVDYQPHFVISPGLLLRAAARALRGASTDSFNAAILQAADMIEPQLFLTVKGLYVKPETLTALKRRGVRTAMYYPDLHFGHAGLSEESLGLYDLFFTTKSFHVPYLSRRFGAERVRYLPHGYSPLAHQPRLTAVAEADYRVDVAYVGNHSPYKALWLEAVARRLPSVTMTIVGNRWAEACAGTALEPFVLGHELVGDFHARVVQTSRINIAIHSGPDGPHGWEDLVSTRTFEIPASKGFMLHIDNPEVRDFFEPGREIDVFADPDQLCERIATWLARPDDRRAMIEAAFARCVPAYSYYARAESLLADVSRLT